jgi:transcription elongation factor GreA
METPVYLTREGLEKMKEELLHLKNVRRREVAARIEKAKDLGDLRENADYHDAKEEASWVETRVIELSDKIRRAQVVDELRSTDQVSIGSTVTLARDGKAKNYTLVGATEADPLAGRISNESPLGLAVLGRRVGETFDLELPSGRVTYEVQAIS